MDDTGLRALYLVVALVGVGFFLPWACAETVEWLRQRKIRRLGR